MGEHVESPWLVVTKDVKRKLKRLKLEVAPELFRIHNKRHQDLPEYYAKETTSIIVGKFAWQLCNHGHDPILYAGEGSKFWTMTLDFLRKKSFRSCIDLGSARH